MSLCLCRDLREQIPSLHFTVNVYISLKCIKQQDCTAVSGAEIHFLSHFMKHKLTQTESRSRSLLGAVTRLSQLTLAERRGTRL